MSEICQKLS